MPVLYEILSIAGWAALVLFLCYWGLFDALKRRKPSRETISTPTDKHENQP